MNAELCKRAAEKVGNPNILVNLISRRVRQLNSGGGGLSRPLISDVGNLGAADIALRELLEDKIGWEMPEPVELVRPQPKKREENARRFQINFVPPEENSCRLFYSASSA